MDEDEVLRLRTRLNALEVVAGTLLGRLLAQLGPQGHDMLDRVATDAEHAIRVPPGSLIDAAVFQAHEAALHEAVVDLVERMRTFLPPAVHTIG